jgi:hypothetical protein
VLCFVYWNVAVSMEGDGSRGCGEHRFLFIARIAKDQIWNLERLKKN